MRSQLWLPENKTKPGLSPARGSSSQACSGSFIISVASGKPPLVFLDVKEEPRGGGLKWEPPLLRIDARSLLGRCVWEAKPCSEMTHLGDI